MKATCAAFANESGFDAHRVEEVQKEDPRAAVELQQRIQQLSERYTQNFVLTHVDLNVGNIQVLMAGMDDTTEPLWQLSNILGWECSGLFPEYMEHAIARISLSHDPEWQQFMSELMLDMNIHCSEERVAVEYMAKHDASYWYPGNVFGQGDPLFLLPGLGRPILITSQKRYRATI